MKMIMNVRNQYLYNKGDCEHNKSNKGFHRKTKASTLSRNFVNKIRFLSQHLLLGLAWEVTTP